MGGILQNFSMEGIQEFALSTQRFSAANSRSGGALLSVVSKSGTNDYHGSIFGFFRDDALNANAPPLLAKANSGLFPNSWDAVKPPFSRQQFGGPIGGPIKQDKAFFFSTVERTRERGNSIVPGVDQVKIKALEPFGCSCRGSIFGSFPVEPNKCCQRANEGNGFGPPGLRDESRGIGGGSQRPAARLESSRPCHR